ncbi:MAG: hypothetical protein LBG15_03755 [Dysgonamonadaceae bacterium]|nr:hypothetical protein [Dysgonamonadaceae bacterium]
MKRIVLIICLTVSTLSLQAQKLKKGNLKYLKEETKICVIFDYSSVTFDGMEEEYFIEKNAKDSAWINKWYTSVKPNLHRHFILEMNKELVGKLLLRAGDDPDAKYQATIKMLKMNNWADRYTWFSSSEPDFDAEITITKTNSTEVLAIIFLNAEGNHFAGTIESRGESTYEKGGEQLGEFFVKKIR